MIDPSEVKFIGKWEVINGRPVADFVSQKINKLISEDLVKVGASTDG
jgi:hypothetical protein